MGNLTSIILGVGNRPRQGRAVLEILALLYLLKQLRFNQPTPVSGTINSISSASGSPRTGDSRVESPTPAAEGDQTNNSASFPESVNAVIVANKLQQRVQRRPSLTSNTSSSSNPSTPTSRLAQLNQFLKQYQPLQIVLGVLIGVHIWKNLSLLLGLNAPHHSMIQEPDMHYSKNFARVRWFLTGLDAATLSTLKVKIPFLRHALTLILGIYYLINFRQAEDKVNAFRRSMTHEAIRACWEKGTTPILSAVDSLLRKKCKIDLEELQIPSPDGHQIECRLFYPKDRSQLQTETRLLLDFPGGGFIAMSPRHHADYLSYWANTLGIPVLSVNYRKAPKFPFPCGFEDVWYVYKAIIDSNGGCIGINSGPSRTSTPIKLAIAGDSAGGNFAAGVCVKAIFERVRVPDGIHMIYPVLDFAGEIWRSSSLPPSDHQIIARESPAKKAAYPSPLESLSREPQHHRPDDEGRSEAEVATLVDPSATSPSIPLVTPPSTAVSATSSTATSFVSPTPTDIHGVPQLSSRTMYAFDGVLPFKYMLLLADCYFRNGGDPINNPLASPMAAADHILAQFPPIYSHVGSVDPLVDDVVRFCRRAQLANPKNDIYLCVIPKISHAYLHVVTLLPEAKSAVDLSASWLAKILDIDLDATPIKRAELTQRLDQLQMHVTDMKQTIPTNQLVNEENTTTKQPPSSPIPSSASSSVVPLPATNLKAKL